MPPHQLTPEFLAEDDGQTLIAISVLFIVVDTVFVVLRFYAVHVKRSPIGLDDFIIPVAWLTHIGLCALGIVMVNIAGVGRHLQYNVHKNPHILVHWAKSLYALEWLYLASAALPKISMCLLYLRIFTNKAAKLATHAVIWVIILNWIAFILATSLQCTPFAYQWNKKIPGGKCVGQQALYKASSAPNIATDVVIMLLPIKTTWDLKISTARKIGVLLVFAAGSMGIVSSCVRMAAFFQTDAFEDNTWASVKLVGWSIVEPGMYIAAACSVRMRPLVPLLKRKLHIKDIYASFSSDKSRGNGSKTDNLKLRGLPISRSGFDRIDNENNEAESTKGIVHAV